VKIGIIGSGNIGGTLARRWVQLGYRVSLANSRGPASLSVLAQEIGAIAATVEEAVDGADVVVVTIPLKNVPQLPKEVFRHLPPSTVIIDTCNYYPRQRDGYIAAIEEGLPESRWVEQQLGHPVIKVFNNIMASHLLNNGQPRGTPGRIALPVAGNDATAKGTVMRLVDELGFDPVDAGTLDESWRQQPGTPAYVKDLDASSLTRALLEAQPERTSDWRA
jgi:predicted dinucleotide-binding enzyme